jgi:hypothetical protein
VSVGRGQLWAVTSYYNPAGFRRRRENYAAFRRCLGVPLLTVELAGPGGFALDDGDADILVRLTGEAAIWQKERLINIGVAALPPEAETVAWIDCDILFERGDWASAAQDLVARAPGFHQLFTEAIHLPAAADPAAVTPASAARMAPDFAELGAVEAVRRGQLDLDALLPSRSVMLRAGTRDLRSQPTGCPGIAWAAPRALLGQVGLFDLAITGSGDIAVHGGAAGVDAFFERAVAPTQPHRAAYLMWSARARAVLGRSGPASVEGRVFHLWHGRIEDRQYGARHAVLRRHGFDPARDLRLAANGTWAWREPEGPLAGDLRTFFRNRREDG